MSDDRTTPSHLVEAASKAFAEATDYYVPFHRGLSSPSADKIRKGILAAIPIIQRSCDAEVAAWLRGEADVYNRFFYDEVAKEVRHLADAIEAGKHRND